MAMFNKIRDDVKPGMLVRYYIGTNIARVVAVTSDYCTVELVGSFRKGRWIVSKPGQRRDVRVVCGSGRPWSAEFTYWSPCVVGADFKHAAGDLRNAY